MVSPFEIIVKKMIELGFYDFLFPFLITSAIFYGLLKKSKIVSESQIVNATLALSVSFLIFGFPILANISLATPFSAFFIQTTVFVLIFVIGLLIASMFYPDLGRFLTEYFVERRSRTIWVLIALGIAIFVMSGMVGVITAPLAAPPKPGMPPGPPTDVVVVAAAIVIFTIVLLIAASVLRVEK